MSRGENVRAGDPARSPGSASASPSGSSKLRKWRGSTTSAPPWPVQRPGGLCRPLRRGIGSPFDGRGLQLVEDLPQAPNPRRQLKLIVLDDAAQRADQL